MSLYDREPKLGFYHKLLVKQRLGKLKLIARNPNECVNWVSEYVNWVGGPMGELVVCKSGLERLTKARFKLGALPFPLVNARDTNSLPPRIRVKQTQDKRSCAPLVPGQEWRTSTRR